MLNVLQWIQVLWVPWVNHWVYRWVSAWSICPQNTSPPAPFIFHNFFLPRMDTMLNHFNGTDRSKWHQHSGLCHCPTESPPVSSHDICCLLILPIIAKHHIYVTLITRSWPHWPPFNFLKTQNSPLPLQCRWVFFAYALTLSERLSTHLFSPSNIFEGVDCFYPWSLTLSIIVS